MKILFISRAFQPMTGGLENQNRDLAAWLGKNADLTLIANRHGKWALPFFLPYALMRALLGLRRYDLLLLGDGVLGIIGFCAKLVYPKKTVVSVIHGLDLTYSNGIYQTLWVRCFLPALDGFIAVSKETRERALEKQIPEDKVVVIPNGLEPEKLRQTIDRHAVANLLHEDLSGKYILLTAGRLAKRKGAAWFIRNVMPKLPENVLYVLAGVGPEEVPIREAIAAGHLEKRVKMLGRVSDETRNLLLNSADVFVQPNIHVPGDMEGFGISVIEAAACKCPVVASDLEGLKDAITPGQNGILVEPENAAAFTESIIGLLKDETKRKSLGERAAEYTDAHFHWRIVSRLYIEALEAFMIRVQS